VSVLESTLRVNTPDVSEAFEKWLAEGHQTGSYPGLRPADCDITEPDHIEVTYDNRKPLKIFYSYSHEDEEARLALEKHLVVLRRQRRIEDWYDRHMTAGQNIDDKIKAAIDSADIILLLISASFMASNYCYTEEMGRALRRHQRGETRIIPIVVRAVDWHDSPIGGLLALPKDGQPVKSWIHEDEAWADVVKGLRKVIEELA
jgi:hypothetical protein